MSTHPDTHTHEQVGLCYYSIDIFDHRNAVEDEMNVKSIIFSVSHDI